MRQLKVETPNQINSAKDAAQLALLTLDHAKAYMRFGHDSGKWYQIVVRRTSNPQKFVVHRLYGGKGSRRPGKTTAVMTWPEIRKVLLKRLQNGYYVVESPRVPKIPTHHNYNAEQLEAQLH